MDTLLKLNYSWILPNEKKETSFTGPSAPIASEKTGPARFVARLMSGLMNEGVKRRIYSEFLKLEPKLEKEMPEDGGILLLVRISEGPRGAEYPLRALQGVYWQGRGKDPNTVLNDSLARDQMFRDVKDAKIIRGYVWVTR